MTHAAQKPSPIGPSPFLAGFEAKAELFATDVDPAKFFLDMARSPLVSTYLKPVMGPAYKGIENALSEAVGKLPKVPILVGMMEGSLSLARMQEWMAKTLGLPSAE